MSNNIIPRPAKIPEFSKSTLIKWIRSNEIMILLEENVVALTDLRILLLNCLQAWDILSSIKSISPKLEKIRKDIEHDKRIDRTVIYVSKGKDVTESLEGTMRFPRYETLHVFEHQDEYSSKLIYTGLTTIGAVAGNNVNVAIFYDPNVNGIDDGYIGINMQYINACSISDVKFGLYAQKGRGKWNAIKIIDTKHKDFIGAVMPVEIRKNAAHQFLRTAIKNKNKEAQ